MVQNTGYIIIFDEPKRSEILQKFIETRSEFSEALSIPDWKIKDHEVCLLSFDGDNLTHVALAERGRQFVSYKQKVVFRYIINFEPINIKMIEREIGGRLRRHFTRVSNGIGGRVPPKTWNSLKSIIKSINPDALNKIERLENRKKQSNIIYDNKPYQVLAQEKDALALSLSIFDIDRSKILPYWISDNSRKAVAPFLHGIKSSEISEDTIIIHDSKTFGDWNHFKDIPIMAAVEFNKHDEKLTVLNTNRTSIERTLGVDLIYYHHTYDSFVLIQYKKMSSKSKDSRNYAYWPNSDKSYNSELERMEAFESKYMVSKSEISLNGFRLHETPFFFKICSPMILNPLSSDMISGMYIPLTYWRVLLESGICVGPRGGIAISYSNIVRRLNNTSFIKLVQDGWIGSTPDISKHIINIIRNLLDLNHSVTIAISRSRSDD